MALRRRLAVLALAGAGAAACATPPASAPADPEGPAARAEGVKSILFASTSSTQAPHDAVLPLVFAVTAKRKGHEAVLFLGGDGVLLMKDSVAADVKAVGQPAADELLGKAVGLGIPIRI